MENNKNQTHKDNNTRSVVDKVASGERASFSDEPLTPERKMEAEEKRMKAGASAETRAETDKQQTSLGGPILTPQQKMDNARKESQANNRKNTAE